MGAEHVRPEPDANAQGDNREQDGKADGSHGSPSRNRSPREITSGAGSRGSRQQVAEPEAVAFDHLADRNGERTAENGSVEDEGVELAVLSAGIHPLRQIGQESVVERPADERGVEGGGVQADDPGAESVVHEPPGQRPGGPSPEREHALEAEGPQLPQAVVADVLEKEVPERDSPDAAVAEPGERLAHGALVDLVRGARRDRDLGERKADRGRLLAQQGAANPVHADPVVPLGHRGDQLGDLEPVPGAQGIQRKRTVLAAAEGEGDRAIPVRAGGGATRLSSWGGVSPLAGRGGQMTPRARPHSMNAATARSTCSSS